MYIISSRAGFFDPDHLLQSGHLYGRVALAEGEVDRLGGFEQLDKVIANSRVLLLVHGYNNEHDEVLDAYQTVEHHVANQLAGQYDHVLGYSWPGGDYRLEWFAAKSRANAVAARFRRLIVRIAHATASLDVMSHSLGARVVLKALRGVPGSGQPVRNYFCLAAAVDNESLEQDKEFAESINHTKAMFVLHSNKDGVLTLAYRVAEFDRALGLSGPEDKAFIENRTPNVFVVNCKNKVDRHGGYKHSVDVYSYMLQALGSGVPRFATL
ncbi:MAG: alpha/beta hydrolase [Gammaproteobacteria bacterium]|nr:alpha/beta hydrolase [Gammaproteobacteria bacterium]